MKVSEAGPWKVHEGTVIGPDGSTKVTVISDGETEWHSAADPVALIVALMLHLGIEHIGPSADPT